jgi:hypothetical protein
MKFSDQEIDALLASVEDAMAQADKLAKSMPGAHPQVAPAKPMMAPKPVMGTAAPMAAPMKKEGEDEQAAPDAVAPEAAAPEAAPAAPAPDAAPDAPQGDDQLQADAQDQGEISDEELQQIYASMDPAELQRHCAIIQSLMGQSDAAPEAAPAAPEAAPAPEAPAASPDAMKAEGCADDEEMGKSEGFKKLKAENDALKKSLDKVVAAMGNAFKPTRKAVTNIEYISKSEQATDDKPLVKSEVIAQLNKITASPSLSKSERISINDFILTGGSQKEVKNILKGGK